MRRIMRGLLRIVGALPLVLGLGAFRNAYPQADISHWPAPLSWPAKCLVSLRRLHRWLAGDGRICFNSLGKYQRAGTTIHLAPAI
ncbi:hypothetical protein ABIE85_002025 [Bradyrhizobium diazoefficiens]|uniref:hypothetical protein n=1 Tax=Bradyrhizobium diazoefficiens TaxID=1355477 RepID=UPI001B5C1DFF|nr:hypothetical protein [Bradyrhizobium diazoefficiens]MBP1092804.1 hypothetical protein [Bradyrhizobium japonicum]WLA60805.1 hypothetical protein QIH81_19695 [Bradyrhizobium diazoefficiens]